MENVTHVQDADKLIDFFSNDREIYESRCQNGGLISFCLNMLNIEHFDIKDVEASMDDLRSIVQIISNSLSQSKREEFNSIVAAGIDRYDKWLHGVFNHMIPIDNEDLLFDAKSMSSSLATMMASIRVMPEDYIRVESPWEGYKYFESEESQLSDELSKEFPVSPIMFLDGKLVFCEKSVKWTGCNKIGFGDVASIENMINGKYRKKSEKRLITIISECYKRIGDKMCFKILSIEDGSLDKEDSYVIDTKTPDDGCIVSIRKKR